MPQSTGPFRVCTFWWACRNDPTEEVGYRSLEILLSKDCPIQATLFAKLHWRQCLAYLWIFTWGLRSMPELCYAFLPAYCIITNSHFLPKVPSHAFYSFYVHLSSLISFQKKKKGSLISYIMHNDHVHYIVIEYMWNKSKFD